MHEAFVTAVKDLIANKIRLQLAISARSGDVVAPVDGQSNVPREQAYPTRGAGETRDDDGGVAADSLPELHTE